LQIVTGVFAEQVKAWPADQYGKFYNGDSYIILNTYKEKDSEVRFRHIRGVNGWIEAALLVQ
jgi:hypothetical protein